MIEIAARTSWAAVAVLCEEEEIHMVRSDLGREQFAARLEEVLSRGGQPMALVGLLDLGVGIGMTICSTRVLNEGPLAREICERIAEAVLEVCAEKGCPAHRAAVENN